jgi:hypothetical protein
MVDPDSGKCVVCPTSWPGISGFEGPPVLRGVLWLDQGEFRIKREGRTISLVELRDQKLPVSLIVGSGNSIDVDLEDPPDASLKILVRPDGIKCCLSAQLKVAQHGATPEYLGMAGSDRLWVGDVSVRITLFEVPAWAGT